MASPTWWTRVWPSSRSWWCTGKPGVLQSIGSQRVRHDWATELNCVTIHSFKVFSFDENFQDSYLKNYIQICNVVVIQSPGHVQLFSTPWAAAPQASLSLTNSWSLPKFMSIALVMPSNHLILWYLLLLLPSIFPSIRDFSSEWAIHIRWPKYWSFSFRISLSNEHLGMISFKTDWFDLLTVQGTLRSLLQHHSLRASILWVLCLLYGPTLTTVHVHWEDHTLGYMDLCRQWYLCFSTHCHRFVIAFLPRSNCLLISWLQSPSIVIVEPKKKKSVTASIFSLSICHKVMGPYTMILVFFHI